MIYDRTNLTKFDYTNKKKKINKDHICMYMHMYMCVYILLYLL